MLDFSRRAELSLQASIIAEVQSAADGLGIEPMIVGAFARDLHLVHAHGVPVLRQTEDVDFALAVPDWNAFDRLRERLLATGRFNATRVAHQLRHGALPLDLVPFGAVETEGHRIEWPPRGEMVMDAFGLREAARDAVTVILPGAVRTKVVSLSALALLKLVCWQDRHLRMPLRDASDIMLILDNYLKAGNEERLWEEFLPWTQDEDFDYELAGSRMLGGDIGRLLDVAGRDRLVRLLQVQSDPDQPGVLAREMNRDNPDRIRGRLAAMLRGLEESGR